MMRLWSWTWWTTKTATTTVTREAARQQQQQQQQPRRGEGDRGQGQGQRQGQRQRRQQGKRHGRSPGPDPDPDPVGSSKNSNRSSKNLLRRPVKITTGRIVVVMAIFVVVVVVVAAVVNNFSLLYKVTYHDDNNVVAGFAFGDDTKPSSSSAAASSSSSPSGQSTAVSSIATATAATPKPNEQGQQQEEEEEDPKTIFWKRSMKKLRESINDSSGNNNERGIKNSDSHNNNNNNSHNKYVSLIMTRECHDVLLLLHGGGRGHRSGNEGTSSQSGTTMATVVVDKERIQEACHYHQAQTQNPQTQTRHEGQQQQQPSNPVPDNRLPSLPRPLPPLPLVVTQLRGEMGNHLGSLGHGIGLQLWLFEKHNLTTGLVVLHQLVTIQQEQQQQEEIDNNNKSSPSTSTQPTSKPTYRWGRHGNSPQTIRTLKECFPLLADLNYELGMSLTSPDTWIDGFILDGDDGVDDDGNDDDGDNTNTSNSTHLLLQLSLARRIHNVNGANPRTWSSSSSSSDSKATATPTPTPDIMDRRRVPVTPQLIDDGLNAAVELWNIRQRQQRRRRRRQSQRDGGGDTNNNNNILLYSESLDNRVFATKYKRAFQTLFGLDEQNPKCCLPTTMEGDDNNNNKKKEEDPDENNSNHHYVVVEHLFHYRNFGLELLGVEKNPQKQAAAFEEVTPQQLYELLTQYGDIDISTTTTTAANATVTAATTTTATQQLQLQHRVTILTRRRSKHQDLDSSYEDPALKEFVDYLSRKDPPITVNVVEGNSGVQDFCSIVQYVRRRRRRGRRRSSSSISSDKQTKTDGGLFIGPQRSTFSEWGTILGSTSADEYDKDDDDDASSNSNYRTIHPSAVLYAIHSNALEKQYSPNTLQFFDGNRYDSNYALRKSSSSSSSSMTLTSTLAWTSLTLKNQSVGDDTLTRNYDDDGDHADTSIRRVLINP